MSKITFILGGARSGKSTHALELAKKYKQVAFIATCQALDIEMEQRIGLHRKNRPQHWKTFEEEKDIALALKKTGNKFDCIIIDCLTLLISNLLLSGSSENLIEDKINKTIPIIRKLKGKVIIVSNEVGLGIVPNTRLGRDFRDIAGKINQIVAKNSDEVFFMISGIPWRIK
jgi:adenosylcobinamide kinase/adenosylcobinamide-phosphate guanylyltransferase